MNHKVTNEKFPFDEIWEKKRKKSPNNNLEKINKSIFKTYFYFNRLKRVSRQGWLDHGVPASECESVGDHTLGTAFLALILSNILNLNLDREKLLTMAILHDLGESKLGDLTPHQISNYYEKEKQEKKIIQTILSLLPQKNRFMESVSEYFEKKTPESQFIRSVDKLEMLFQAIIYEYQYPNLNFNDFFKLELNAIPHPVIRQFLQQLQDLRSSQKH